MDRSFLCLHHPTRSRLQSRLIKLKDASLQGFPLQTKAYRLLWTVKHWLPSIVHLAKCEHAETCRAFGWQESQMQLVAGDRNSAKDELRGIDFRKSENRLVRTLKRRIALHFISTSTNSIRISHHDNKPRKPWRHKEKSSWRYKIALHSTRNHQWEQWRLCH